VPDALAIPASIVGRADGRPRVFECSWTDGGLDGAWVHVAGELDLASVPRLERTLRAPQLQARLIVLDLRDLQFIDSYGVRSIVNASIDARRAGCQLVLLRGTPNVDRMFTLTGRSADLQIGDVDPTAEVPGAG
jgi:anti-sigma B factor antagonist